MEGSRLASQQYYSRSTPDSYYHLYGTVRGNPLSKSRISLDGDSSSSRTKKPFNFLPWKKNKSKSEDFLQNNSYVPSNLSKHNKYKFGSVSALSSASLYRDSDWDSSLSHTPSFSASDLKHATVRSAGLRSRRTFASPWENYKPNLCNPGSVNVDTSVNTNLNNNYAVSKEPFKAKPVSLLDKAKITKDDISEIDLKCEPVPCNCQKKKSGPFGTLNLKSFKSNKCSCNFSSVRSTRGFAPPPPRRRKSILPDKVDLYALHEEHQPYNESRLNDINSKVQNNYGTIGRSNKYKAPQPPVIPQSKSSQEKLIRTLENAGRKDPYSSVASRKSILECDVTAYDLVKNYLKSSVNDIDSDIDDSLSDNAIEIENKKLTDSSKSSNEKNQNSNTSLKSRTVIDQSPSPVSSESESGIYSHPSSVSRIGGHGMKVFSPSENGSGSQASSLYSEGSKTNSVDSRASSWSNSSTSDDGIYSLPEPDYDRDSDLDTILGYDIQKPSAFSSPATLRKFASGDCLSTTEIPGDFRQSEFINSSAISVRRASSMISLSEKNENGRYMQIRVSDPQPIPPPPPPPPPPPNYLTGDSRTNLLVTKNSLTKVKDPEINNNISEKGNMGKTKHNSISSSIAAELTEKLKTNQPILRKKEFPVKSPVKNEVTNPYMEVKSILKKTGELNLNREESTGFEKLPAFQELQDIKKKKRVQFKSLSNESLVIEHIAHKSLSSSDEEWEEARESFDDIREKNTNNATTDSVKDFNVPKNNEQKCNDNEGFQTVEEFLKSSNNAKNSNSVCKPELKQTPMSNINSAKNVNKTGRNLTRTEYKSPSKVVSLSRPTQPPPPPPYPRKTNNSICPPPRPLKSTPKRFSHCDLRSGSSTPTEKYNGRVQISNRAVVRTNVRPQVSLSGSTYNSRLKPRVQNGPITVNGVTEKRENSVTCSKNGVPSPAASPEVMTSTRGKVHTACKVNNQCEDSSSSVDGATEDVAPNAELQKSDGNLPTKENSSNYCQSCYNKLEIPLTNGNRKTQSSENFSKQLLTNLNNFTCENKENDSKVNNKNIICQVRYSSNSTDKLNEDNNNNGVQNENEENENIYGSNIENLSDSYLLKNEDSPEVENPVYSNLLYVPCRQSPSPPPLPLSPPPKKIPPKLTLNIVSTKADNTTTVITAEEQLQNNNTNNNILGEEEEEEQYQSTENYYDKIPRNPAKEYIYESRRYIETGATVVTISSGYADPRDCLDRSDQEHIYASLGSEGIYEELPALEVPSKEFAGSNPFGRHRRSFFEGASKAEILNYLEDAKDRVVLHLPDEENYHLNLDEDDDEIPQSENVRNNPIRISNISNSSESSSLSSNSSSSRSDSYTEDLRPPRNGKPAEVERADSGVGAETSKPHRVRKIEKHNDEEVLCADCDQQMEPPGSCPAEVAYCPLVCEKCEKKRSERKEIVTEIVETEFKYGKDLMIIKEEFYTPMEVAALLTREQLRGIFLNLEELILVNGLFSEKLKDAVDIAAEQGDEDYTTVNIGKLFLEISNMLQAFEVYCVQQGSASVLLSNLEKEKELLRIFLKVSQMENTLLRRMNLSAFLMVPVQRVTKYPLLLNRLHKVTPYHHKDRETLREAQLKIELHLEHINQQTKGISGTKIWRRLSNISTTHRRISNVSDIGSIQFRKVAMEILQWSKEEIRFVMAGKLQYSCTADFSRSRRGRATKFTPSHALLATLGKPNSNYRPDLIHEATILFPRNTGIRDATLLLMKEKNGRYTLIRDPLHLGSCVISSELEDEDIIEIQEYTTKESIFLKAECRTDALDWLKQLRYHAKDLGTWRRRRNALANIMINGMIRQ